MKNATNHASHQAVLILALIGLIWPLVLELATGRPASAQPILQDKVSQSENPDLTVVKFSWTKGRDSLIRGAQNPGGPIVTPSANARDLASRRAEMRVSERKAAISTDKRGIFYLLQLEVKNTGTKVIKSFAWEYKPNATPQNYEPKEYICVARAKPNQSKVVKLVSPFAPVKVISVGAWGNGLKEGEVVVNQIEYEDGTIWKRAGWLIKLPPDTTKKLANGQCAVF